MATSPDFVYAADTTNMQAGGNSIFEDAADMVTKGAPAALVSGFSSIYNTGVDVANYFGADADRINVHNALADVDQNWAQYYDQHQGAIDVAGFIATSFVPGGLAVKGLNLARRGEGAGALARTLNYTTIQQTQNLEKALQTVASPEGSVFTMMNKNYLAALGWGAADQVLQTAAFEVAVATTMNASPILDGESAKDLTHDVIKNALFGGAFGGAIEGIFMRSITKDAIARVDKSQRKYDILGAGEGLGLSNSDTAYSFIDAALKLPKQVFEDDRVLDFTYKLNGKNNAVKLETGKLYDQALEKSVRNAWTDFEGIVNNKLADDTSASAPFARAMLDLVRDGKKAKATDDDIRQRLGDYMFHLEKVEGIGSQYPDVTPEKLHWFNKAAKPTEYPFSTEKIEGASSFRLVGKMEDLKVAVLGSDANTVKEAWENGFDLAIKPDQTWTVNPKSSTMRPALEPKGNQLIFNTRTGNNGLTATPTIADVATKEVPLKVAGDTIVAGDRKLTYKLGEDPINDVVGGDSVYYTGRHLWAASLQKIDGEVNGNDISVLDRMSSAKQVVSDNATINLNGDVRNWRDFGNFDDFVFSRKLALLQDKLGSGEKDIQKLAYELNTTPGWVQDAIGNKFNMHLSKQASGAPDLSTGFQRGLDEYGQRENVVLTYKAKDPALYVDDYGNTFESNKFVPAADNFGGSYMADQEGQRAFITGSQAYQYRVKLATDNLNVAFNSVFGEDSARFLNFTADELTALANRNPTGAGIVTSANAGYGDKLRLFSQFTGTETNSLARKLSDANLKRLQPLMAKFLDGSDDARKAAGELTTIVTKLRTSPSKFTVLGADFALDDALTNQLGGAYLIDKALVRGSSAETLAAVKDALLTGTQEGMQAFHIESDLVTAFLKEHMAINSDLIQKRAVLANARGQISNKDPGTLYVPPIDTKKVPFFALVRPVEGKMFSDQSVGMITARSDKELLQLAGQIDPASGLEVIYKGDTEKFHKALGDYQYSRNLSENSVDSTLRSQGKLGDFLPSFNVESTLEDFLNFHQRQATQLVRDGVSTKYAQTIAEFQRLSEQYTLAKTSQFKITDKLFRRELDDPYDDVIKGMLDVSKRSEFTLLHQTNEMLDAMGTRAYRAAETVFKQAATGTATWEEANSTLTKYGLGAPFKDQVAFDIAKTPEDRNLLKTTLQKANMVLSTALLRFDFANSLVNIISTPIMLGTELSSIRQSVKNNPELAGKLAELTSIPIPEGGGAIPSMTKLIANSIKNWFGPDKDALVARYTEGRMINPGIAKFHEMVDDLSLTPNLVPSKYAEKVDKWVETIAKGTGNNFAEQFTRFVSADVMRQISDPLLKAGRMTEQEQNAFMSIFTNRVQGNYIASQRPILFQGTLGSALGLFQTYQFNMLQQLYRHIENRDLKSIAVMAGLQTSVYGLNGLPAFDAINSKLIGDSNLSTGHKDIYSYLSSTAGAYGDWLLYGTASAFPLFGDKAPALYTRGDINPRHPFIIPTAPQDIPAVDASVRFVKNLFSTFGKVANGGDIQASLLEGLEHNSINRPLAGLAQAMQGYSTTSQGSLVSQSADLFSIANASRILGAKPLDESIGLNAKYRQLAYQAEDKARIEDLGSAVKTTLKNGRSPSDEQMTDFMGKYAAAGGRIENFGATMQKWSKDSTQSVLNQLSDKVRSPYGQRFVETMGGKRVDDFTTPTQQEPPQ